MIKENSYVLDLGCNDGEMIRFLENEKKCKTVGVDENVSKPKILGEYYSKNLDTNLPNISFDEFDYIIFLDVIEHLKIQKFLCQNFTQNYLIMKKFK